MVEKIKWYVFVFFARIKCKREIKELKQDLQDLSWTLGVEKNSDPKIANVYEETKAVLFFKENLLKGLQY